MPVSEIGLVARAKGLTQHLLPRETLETLAEADDFGAVVRGLSRLGRAIDPIGEPFDMFAVERAIGRRANRHLRTLYRWQERMTGVLDVFAAHQDRRSLRALLRGAWQGAPPEQRLEGLLPTSSLPQRALSQLAREASPADVARQLVLLGHPDARRLLPLVRTTRPDLLVLEQALLAGFAERARHAAARADETVREFVNMLVDAGNAQNAIMLAGDPRDVDPADVFVQGGRWLSLETFLPAARGSQQHASTTLATALARSPLGSWLPVVPGDVANLDRAFLAAMLKRLGHLSRIDPLSHAPLLRTLFLIEAQSRDLRTLAWGAVLGTPVSVRKRQMVTPA
jgi:V/A-type H+-transporting ATPase subunit C